MSLTAFLLIWCNVVFLWILLQKTATPNSSAFVEIDVGSKSAYPSGNSLDNYSEWSQMLRQSGLDNSESKAIVRS
jgi:hypothetical protein